MLFKNNLQFYASKNRMRGTVRGTKFGDEIKKAALRRLAFKSYTLEFWLLLIENINMINRVYACEMKII